MSQLKELLDLEARRIDADPDALDSVFHLRDRRRRDRRIGAAVVGLAVFAAVVVFFAARIGDPRSLPATPTPTPAPAPALLHNGEIAVRADIGNHDGAILQIDPTSGEETRLPVAIPPEDLWFRGLDRRSNTDLWWSPDGTELAYLKGGDPYEPSAYREELWVLDVSTGESRKIAESGGAVAWSPDGTTIAIAGGHNLEVMKPDGSDRTVIKVLDADGNGFIVGLAWTPDGEQILFADESEPNLRQRDLYVIDRDGANLTLLDEYRFESRDVVNPVAYSPDGTRVAYFTWSYSGGSRPEWRLGIAVADLDGSNRQVVLEDAGECCDDDVFWYPYLGWSPDGTQLAFTIDGPDDQPQGLYVMNADGTDVRLLREDVMARPAWRPAPEAPATPEEVQVAPSSPAITEVGLDPSAPVLEPRRTRKEIARIALDAIAEYEDQVGRKLAQPRVISITLVQPGVVFESASQTYLWWAVRFEGTIAMWGGTSVPAWFGYPRGVFGISDDTGEIQFESVDGTPCFVPSGNDKGPPGFGDTPPC